MHPVIELISGIALLLWGTYMVKTAMLRTFGLALRDVLSKQLQNRIKGFIAGFCLSSLLQSSTAATLLVAGLQSEAVVTTAIGLSAIMGADLGSAFMARLLSFNLSSVSPFLIIAGAFIFFYKTPRKRSGQFGRVLLGLGFVMMALSQIIASTQPLRNSTDFFPIFQMFADMPILAMLAGALLALGCFSSLAAVVIIQGLLTAGVLPVYTALWAVLGANIESTVLAVITTLPVGYAGRRGPTINGLYRLSFITFGAVCLFFIPWLSATFTELPDAAIYFHLAFNTVSGISGLFFIMPMAQLAEKLLPTPTNNPNLPQSAKKLFVKENLISASVSLNIAQKEICQSIQEVDSFWSETTELLKRNPEEGLILQLLDRKKYILNHCETISLFLSRVIQEPMVQNEAILWQNLKSVNGSLKLTLTLMNRVIEVLREQKCTKNKEFSSTGLQELLTYHARVNKCLNILKTIIETNDDSLRTQLIRQLREERNNALKGGLALTQTHMHRVASGISNAIETSALHLELQSLFNRLCGTIYSAVRIEMDVTDTASYLAKREN